MGEINHFKFLVLCCGDVTANVDHLYVKRIHLLSPSYIVIGDYVSVSKYFTLTSLFLN
jgi:hypothetical protein